MNKLIPALIGTWFICSTTFPMWLKGDKTNPTFTYAIASEKDSLHVLRDEVKYTKNGETKTIKGYDYLNPSDSAAFVWKGNGLLHLLHSRWEVVFQDPDGQWAVVHFSKTLFTPEGIDIISRTPQLPEKTLNHIKSMMADDPVLARQLIDMRDLPITKPTR